MSNYIGSISKNEKKNYIKFNHFLAQKLGRLKTYQCWIKFKQLSKADKKWKSLLNCPCQTIGSISKMKKKNSHVYLVQVNYFLGQKLGRKEALVLDQIQLSKADKTWKPLLNCPCQTIGSISKMKKKTHIFIQFKSITFWVKSWREKKYQRQIRFSYRKRIKNGTTAEFSMSDYCGSMSKIKKNSHFYFVPLLFWVKS